MSTATQTQEHRDYGDRLARARAEALAKIVPILVARDETVRAWRERYLPGGLLQPEQVAAWMRAHNTERDWETITIAAPRGKLADAAAWVDQYVANPEKALRSSPPGVVIERRRDLWHIPGTYDYVVAVPGYGALGTLRRLCERLAGKYGISEKGAVMLLLCGIIEPAEFALVRIRHDWHLPYAAFSRLTIETSVRTSPAQIARAVTRFRRRYLGYRRMRALGTRALELAVFMAEHSGLRLSWRGLMARWNDRHRRWRYDDPRRFRLEAIRAVQRLLGVGPAGLEYAPRIEPLV